MPVGFHFRVNFDLDHKLGTKLSKSTPDIGFQEVSGLNMSIETETYQEGGENRFSHRLPKPGSYQNLVLKRGVLVGSRLIAWFSDAIVDFRFRPLTVMVVLLDESHHPLESWTFYNVIPVKWNIDAFNAQDSKVVAETIELSYQYFVRNEEHTSFLNAGNK